MMARVGEYLSILSQLAKALDEDVVRSNRKGGIEWHHTGFSGIVIDSA